MNNDISNRIYTLRTQKQWTQDQLANKIGVSRQAISKWERGDGLPDLYNIKELAKAFDVSVDDLVGNQPKMTQTDISIGKTGNFFQQLLYKARNTTNSAEAKELRKKLLVFGGIGVVIGISMLISGFVGFAKGAMDSVNNFSLYAEPFNPLPYMALSMVGFIIMASSGYVVYIGLAIVVAGVATDYIDGRGKCPKCGDTIDSDELACSNCGFIFGSDFINCPSCDYANKPEDKFCRKCGSELK